MVGPEYQPRLLILTEKLTTAGLSPNSLNQLFADDRVQLYPETISRTGKGLNYMGRRFGLLKKSSLQRGHRVLREYADILKRIEASSGVNREVIVAILRIETNFGSSTGNRSVFNSLLTMALVENRRSDWAEAELLEFLRICNEQTKDPLSVKGSWAGAIGIPQFVPTSYRRYAVDGDGDGVTDLFNPADSIASVANYLKAHGWQKDQPLKNRDAVYAYNHCDNYVKAVFAYARALKRTAPA